ncbi:PaRep2b protein [Pyrobaculum oguniense TE7]|uniref:PaRep2b protein n=1 Tax=Pyrobaculum oguniense (strain DSM 13380 / JCM 10595 / TE7) TaxID=698757 RepID=H6QAY6_PYROT|nr:PaRep2b protein [Pyrobaculum oguniense TE7]
MEDAERDIKGVIKDVKVKWESGGPRIVVEYEANGETTFLSFI